MLNFHKNHRNLVHFSWLVFFGLSSIIAIVPAFQMQETQALPGMKDLTAEERSGLHVYVAENCMTCHTQQVRNIEMDMTWGKRPSMASDYFYTKKRLDFWRQSPSLLGSERTGPDLTNIGKRQPGKEWHLLHLFNPRIVVKQSIMPSYSWLFYEKDSSKITPADVVVPVPDSYLSDPAGKIVASEKALHLVAYLQSLQQIDLPDGKSIAFIPASADPEKKEIQTGVRLPDGEQLYMQTCAACHQKDGKGIAGAFPPLSGSAIVNDANPEILIRIILGGYDARTEFGVMPPFAEQLSDEEIAAIANHERNSWGNKAADVSAEDVKKYRDQLLNQNP